MVSVTETRTSDKEAMRDSTGYIARAVTCKSATNQRRLQ